MVADLLLQLYNPDPAPRAYPEGFMTTTQKPIRVLVADDHEVMRELLQRMLDTLGYSCDLAEDGTTCLKKLKQNGYDLVFLDLVMPGVDGASTLQKVRAEHPDTMIVVVSSQDDDEVISDILSQGAVAYLAKPVQLDHIRDVMERIEQAQGQGESP